jgi:hypothetical protein
MALQRERPMITMHPEILVKDGQQYAVLPYAEFLQVQAALARLAEQGLADSRYGSFYENLSAAELARRQGVKKVSNLEALAWPSPEDWDGFDAAVDEWRHGVAGEGSRGAEERKRVEES